METLAYAAGFGVFRWLRARHGDVVNEPQRWNVLAAATVGALIGSRLLGAEQRARCLVAGPAHGNFGNPTTLPWAVNMGDAVGLS